MQFHFLNEHPNPSETEGGVSLVSGWGSRYVPYLQREQPLQLCCNRNCISVSLIMHELRADHGVIGTLVAPICYKKKKKKKKAEKKPTPEIPRTENKTREKSHGFFN